MSKPNLKLLKGVWYCKGLDVLGKSKTISGAYASWYRALDRDRRMHGETLQNFRVQLIRAKEELKSTKVELSKANAAVGLVRPDDKWIAERICYYNQACIDLIWKEKRLPSIDEYTELTDRGRLTVARSLRSVGG